MPSSVFFRENYVHVRDGDIVVLLNVLISCLEKSPDRTAWYEKVLNKWRERAQGCGFGCYDLDLDELVTSPDETDKMLGILNDAKLALNAHGVRISKEWLNRLPYRGAIFLADQETSRFLERLEQISDLLKRAGSS